MSLSSTLLFLPPALVLTGMFTFYPLIMSWVYSTFYGAGFSNDMTFVGQGVVLRRRALTIALSSTTCEDFPA